MQSSAEKARALLAQRAYDQEKTTDTTSATVARQFPDFNPNEKPSEEVLIQIVRDLYERQCRPKMRKANRVLAQPDKKKHVLAHLRSKFGRHQFGDFGFGTFREWSERHGLGVYQEYWLEVDDKAESPPVDSKKKRT